MRFQNLSALIFVLMMCALPVFIAGCGGGDSSDDDDDAGADDTASDDDTDDDSAPADDVSDDSGDDTIPADDDTAPATTPGFVYIPAGSFNMGSPTTEIGHRPNEALHSVTLTHAFEMKVTEVRQKEFKDLLGYNPSVFPFFGADSSLPVDSVSWYDAVAFANLLSVEHGYAPCFSMADLVCADDAAGDTATYCIGHGGIAEALVTLSGGDTIYDCEGFRPPTEAEWEYAARAGTETAAYAGDITQVTCGVVDPVLDGIAWYCGNADKYTHPVGKKASNAWGLFDMLGNVEEWTWDWYATELTGPVTDPSGTEDGHFKVVRSTPHRYQGAARIRAAYRGGNTPGYRSMLIGFRPVRTISAESPEELPAPPPPPAGESVRKARRTLPDELPFDLTRPQIGTPLTADEINAFTQTITDLYAHSRYVQRLLWIGHGMAEGINDDWPDYKLQLQDFTASKSGGVVTFSHTGPSDNLMITTGKLFNNVAALYLASGDESSHRFLVTHAKGIKALIMGMTFTDNDPEPYLMPRTPFPDNHSYTEEGGRETVVDYEPVKNYRFDWNGWTIPNDFNPYWSNEWIRNMRSKDDVPHIFRTVPWLMRLVQDAPDEDVRTTAADALEYLTGFADDIVETGYYIRTKDELGNVFIPMNKDYPRLVNDLASFVSYTDLLPSAECDPRLAAAFIAYGEPLGVDCDQGIGWVYESIASFQHYFNWAIIRYFHVAAAHMALITGNDDVAFDLVSGLVRRADDMMDGFGDWDNALEFVPDQAGFLLAAATVGMPLTDEEARLIMEQYTTGSNYFETWAYWDPWDASVPDGVFPSRPGRDISPTEKTVRWEEMSYLMEYCQSPFRNPDGAALVNCDIILDPTQWGE